MAYVLSGEEFEEIIYGAATLGGIIGIVIGGLLAILLYEILNKIYYRNLKNFILELSDEELKGKIEEYIEDLEETYKALCERTNSQYFKKRYNQILELKLYLMKKFIQN